MVQSIVMGETRDIFVVRMRIYADQILKVDKLLQQLIQPIDQQGEHYEWGITEVCKEGTGDEHLIQEQWEG